MKKGFTIIEIVIAIFLLSFALVGVFSAFSIAVISTSDIVNQLTATYLAQEGMEIARNIRDTNWLKMDSENCVNSSCSFGWLNNGLDNCSGGCEADYTTNTSGGLTFNPWNGTGRPLYLNPKGFYSYDTNGILTKFERKITINKVQDVNPVSDQYSDHIISVKVEVSWTKKATLLGGSVSAGNCCPNPGNPSCPPNISNCITTEETLYDWYNYQNH